MSNGKIYLNSGARKFNLPSGDEGIYVDICLDDLDQLLEEHDDKDIKRPWVNKKENKIYNNLRIFVIPKKEPKENDLYPFYLEVARVLPKS